MSGPSERPGQPGGKRATNRAQRTKALADAGLSLFLDQGIEATTIDQITKAAGTAKGSFYRYFDDKAALVEHLIRPIAEQLDAALVRCGEALAETPSVDGMYDAYEVLSAELGGVFLGNPDVVRMYLQDSRGPCPGARAPVAAVRDLITRRTRELTEAARRRDQLADVDPRVSALAVIGASERLLMAVLTGEDVGDPLKASQDLIRLVLDGLRKR